jgi:hypothetical protein
LKYHPFSFVWITGRIKTGASFRISIVCGSHDGKGVSVLLKQYLKAGGRLLAINVDRQFSNAIDALNAVDLRQAPPAVLARYMGKDQAATFRAWHAMRA